MSDQAIWRWYSKESDDQDEGLIVNTPDEHRGYVPDATDHRYGHEVDNVAGQEWYGGLEMPTRTPVAPVHVTISVPVQLP